MAANPYSPNGAVPGNQLGPMAMPGYSTTDIYGGMYTPQPSQQLGQALLQGNGSLLDPGQSYGWQPGTGFTMPMGMDSGAVNGAQGGNTMAYAPSAPSSSAVTAASGLAGLPPGAPPVDSGLSYVPPGKNPGGLQGLFTDGGLLSHGILSGFVGSLFANDPWSGSRGPGSTGAPNSSPMPPPQPYGYINPAAGMTAEQTHAALMAQQHNPPQLDQNGRKVIAVNGQVSRANPDVNQFGMINATGNHNDQFGSGGPRTLSQRRNR